MQTTVFDSFGRGSNVFRLPRGKSAREGVAPLLPRPVDILTQVLYFWKCQEVEIAHDPEKFGLFMLKRISASWHPVERQAGWEECCAQGNPESPDQSPKSARVSRVRWPAVRVGVVVKASNRSLASIRPQWRHCPSPGSADAWEKALGNSLALWLIW